MPRSNASRSDEQPRPGPLPLWEVPGWRERFGVEAGISGVPPQGAEPFELGLWSNAPAAQVMGSWRRLRSELSGFPSAVLAHQVHGARVLWHESLPPGWLVVEGADGHATRTPGLLLMVTVADCVPVYVVAPAVGAVALLHAGWRGVAAGVLEEGIRLLTTGTGVGVENLVIHAGIAISGPQYEVGSEVFEALGLPAPAAKGYLDLRSVIADRARRLGVSQVTVSGHCTASSPGSFHSHRRAGGRAGRMVAWIGVPGGPGGNG